MLMLLLVEPAAARKVWTTYSGGRLSLICYTLDAMCARFGLVPKLGSGNSAQCVRAVDGQGRYPFGANYESTHSCPDGEHNRNAAADGCWYPGTPRDCAAVTVDCPEGELFDGDILACTAPSSPDPDLGGDRCSIPLVGNPIHAGTGNKFESVLDIAAVGPSGLEFTRYYNSRAPRFANATLGRNWSHTYSVRLVAVDKDGLEGVYLYRPEGDGHRFVWSGDHYASQTLPDEELVKLAPGWRLSRPGGIVETFDETGRLLGIRHPDRPDVTLTYDTLGRLSTVSDTFGRRLGFEYDQHLRVTAASDANGARWDFHYDGLGNLVEVIKPDATPAVAADNPRTRYLYEDSRFPWHLTGVVDERGKRTASWAYDDQGRAISSEHAAGAASHRLTFNSDGSTTVEDPLGRLRTYRFIAAQGYTRVAGIHGGDCSQCAQDAAEYAYDARGFLRSKTDSNGNATVFERDGSGRELRRIEAFGSPEERSITTTWHADHRKPVTITEAGRVTSYTYDAQGRMLSSSVQPLP